MRVLPNPHFDITITQRSKGQSAVAGAAYQNGEKLFSEYDQKTKNYSGKRGILYTEIMLPSHAPPEYANREPLWNSVENGRKAMERPAGPALRAGSAQRSPVGTVSTDGTGLLREAVYFQGDDCRLCHP